MQKDFNTYQNVQDIATTLTYIPSELISKHFQNRNSLQVDINDATTNEKMRILYLKLIIFGASDHRQPEIHIQ